MKKVLLVLVFVFYAIHGLAQTNVSGIITSQTWTADKSPYLLVGNLQVVNLVIQPGVKVLATGKYGIEIKGTLTAHGTAQDSIVFSKTDTNSAWNGIFLNKSAPGSELSYCRIEYSNNCGITLLRSFCTLRNCTIQNNQSGGADDQTTGSAVRITDNSQVALYNCMIIQNNSYWQSPGLLVERYSSATLMNCVLSDNHAGSSYTDGAVVKSKESSTVDITNCAIAFNYPGSVYMSGGSVSIRNSIIRDNNFPIGKASIADKITVQYSNVDPNYTGIGNINAVPFYSDTKKLTLLDKSPCIDAGNPDSSFNDISFPPSQGTRKNDMGAYGGPGAADWLGGITAGKLSVTPSFIKFGQVAVGSSRTEPVLLSNFGTASLNVTLISIAGAQADRFFADALALSLAPNATKAVTITFTPQSDSRVVAAMIIKSNGGDETVWLSGNDAEPLQIKAPNIAAIQDVPNDQGKQVLIKWTRSDLDDVISDTAITSYGVWRQVDEAQPAASIAAKNADEKFAAISTVNANTTGPGRVVQSMAEMMGFAHEATPGTVFIVKSNHSNSDLAVASPYDKTWTYIGQTPALQFENYSLVAPTLFDSTTSGVVWSTFFISAHTDNPQVWFASLPDSGYSVDNLSPSMPAGIKAQRTDKGIALTWEIQQEPDLNYYSIYRDQVANFLPVKPIVFATDSFFVDHDVELGRSYYYKITATDFSGNESLPSAEAIVLATAVHSEDSSEPMDYYLGQNYPNPFNPQTTIVFALPEKSHVTISVYNLNGRMESMLFSGLKTAGIHSIVWDAAAIPAGTYFIKMQAEGFVQLRKCILLK